MSPRFVAFAAGLILAAGFILMSPSFGAEPVPTYTLTQEQAQFVLNTMAQVQQQAQQQASAAQQTLQGTSSVINSFAKQEDDRKKAEWLKEKKKK